MRTFRNFGESEISSCNKSAKKIYSKLLEYSQAELKEVVMECINKACPFHCNVLIQRNLENIKYFDMRKKADRIDIELVMGDWKGYPTHIILSNNNNALVILVFDINF